MPDVSVTRQAALRGWVLGKHGELGLSAGLSSCQAVAHLTAVTR